MDPESERERSHIMIKMWICHKSPAMWHSCGRLNQNLEKLEYQELTHWSWYTVKKLEVQFYIFSVISDVQNVFTDFWIKIIFLITINGLIFLVLSLWTAFHWDKCYVRQSLLCIISFFLVTSRVLRYILIIVTALHNCSSSGSLNSQN